MLQAGRSRVRFSIKKLYFSIDQILPAALGSWGRLSLYHKLVAGIFFFGGGGRKLWPARKAENLAAICESIV
jgi:hypothetical protein